jgi:hypothetical protein
LTVSACRVLTYRYTVKDDQLFLRIEAENATEKSCVAQEMAYIRSKMDSTFYFYIMDRIMLFLPPNNQLPIKLDRKIDLSKPALNGVWRITDGVLFSRVTDPLVIMNGVKISMCQGSTSFNSDFTSSKDMNLSRLAKSACNGILTDTLNTSVLYRVNKANQQPILSFYNKNVSLVA